MKKVIIILTIIACIGPPPSLFAQEKGVLSPIMSVPKEAKAKLKTARTIAIFLNGNDSLLTRIAEDTLSINLTNAGFTVINRETLEKAVGEQVAKKKKEKAEGAINALGIGKAVNADSILTGTVIIESSKDKLVLVRIASFQLVDVLSGKTLINILFESEKGKPFSEIANGFVAVLKQNMR
ncbi:MAG: hypothetical protein B5M53_09085 [Candidatus Cloacimonas sp. 4484_209]|nr:MAG: hypothetical protein B5M53_09085 [Candidatus Cloacimonas sp. 4484_209]